MALLILSMLVINCVYSSVIGVHVESEQASFTQPVEQDNSDLNSDASSYYSNRHSAWNDNDHYPYSYENSITGYGLVDHKRYNNYGSIGSSDNYYEYDNYVGSSDINKGYNTHYNWGNGGYGGYGGNGGLNSYYGYNRPNYQGKYHLGYGYYDKRYGHGNIYNNGVTPSLVTGYRGYSKK